MKLLIANLDTIFSSKTFKFLFFAFVIGSIALFVGKLLADQWIDLVKWLGGMATARGIGEHIPNAVGKKKDEISQVVAAHTDDQLAAGVVARTGS